MKPPPFDYVVAGTVDDAISVLGQDGMDTRVLAGGQSLIPMMNFRLARPGRLLDVNTIPDLSYIRKREGALRIGAVTRQSTVEQAQMVARHWPLIGDGLRHVAHPQIRNRGTFGGSIAHADPGAEIPCVLLAYDGYVRLASTRGVRQVAARDLFLGQFVTAMEPDELLVEVVIPPTPPRTGHSFQEYARRAGDFALAGVAALITVDREGVCRQASLSLLGVATTPMRATAAERSVVGRHFSPEVIESAAQESLVGVNPASDIHGSSQYRLIVLKEMVRRALTDAWARSKGEADD